VGWSPRRISSLAEGFAFGAYVALYIWRLQYTLPSSWWLFVLWLVLSFLLRRDTPKTLGCRADNLWGATRNALWFFAPASVLICCAGLFLGILHRTPIHLLAPKKFFTYAAFCLLQQVALNSLLTNRLLAALEKPVPAALLSGAVFGALHWPNPVLMPLTSIGGAAMAWLFARERNILPLALGQAVLGTLVWWAFPIAWHHSMRVGPGFGSFHP
jgi:hypothetical protein